MKKMFIFLFIGLSMSLFSKETKIREQDDFYESVNYNWLKESKIPKGYSSWNNFNILDKKVSDDLRGIVEEYLSKRAALTDGTNEQKLVDFYTTTLDYKNRDADGTKPIKNLLDEVNKISSKKDITKLMIYLFNNNSEVFLSTDIGPDFKDSSTNILYFDSIRLGMPDRDYYLEDTEQSKTIQAAYMVFLKKMFILDGYSEAEAAEKSENVYNFEKELAASMLKREELRDTERLYNPYTVAQLEKSYPNINWREFLAGTKLIKAKKIVLTEPEYVKALNKQIDSVDIKVIKDYLESVILRESSNYLTRDFEKTAFEYSKVFSGIDEMLPDNERAFDLLNDSLGEPLGKIYVEKYFSEEAKQDVKGMVEKIISVYEGRIEKLDWMSADTKKKAVKKLETMTIKVGYPDKWEDYSKISIKTYEKGGSLYYNLNNIASFEREKSIKELNGKVDKSEWGMTPQTINAYYNPTANEIVFPAAILQDPFYKYGDSKAKNYGGIGAVIGHEISHAFDDQGSKFDEKGNLKNWWTKEDEKNYKQKTEALAKQYSGYIVGNKNINGNLTLGENIADLGGVTVALEITEKEAPDDLKEFFYSYGVIWRNLITKERAGYLMKIDPHSPGRYRVNGVLINLDEFYKVYNVTENDKMYKKPEDRIRIW